MVKTKSKTGNPKSPAKKVNFLSNPWIYLFISCLALIGISYFLALPTYDKYIQMQADQVQIRGEIEGNPENGQFFGLKGELTQTESEFVEKQKAVNQANAAKLEILDVVFPAEEDIYFLTNLLELYAVEHDTVGHPFEMTSLSFAKAKDNKPTASTKKTPVKTPKKVSVSPSLPYSIVEINVPLVASPKNFDEFIEFINSSGSLEKDNFYGKEVPVPLMTIESLDFSYQEDPETGQELINANFILNSYLRKSAAVSKTTKK